MIGHDKKGNEAAQFKASRARAKMDRASCRDAKIGTPNNAHVSQSKS